MATLASAMLLVTAARIKPMARSEHTPSEAMANNDHQFRGSGMA